MLNYEIFVIPITDTCLHKNRIYRLSNCEYAVIKLNSDCYIIVIKTKQFQMFDTRSNVYLLFIWMAFEWHTKINYF